MRDVEQKHGFNAIPELKSLAIVLASKSGLM